MIMGCIADDVTGATDLAGAMAGNGRSVTLLLGVPHAPLPEAVDAAVVALKTRTAPASEACAQTLAAHRWLQDQGAQRSYVKYCSTFDSTAAGNIGPVVEQLLGPGDWTVHCPSYPANGRTVYQGHLFVGSRLLSESGMRTHPLTPMADADLVRVLQAQASLAVGLLAADTVRQGAQAARRRLDRLVADGIAHVIADATTDEDITTIAEAVADVAVLAGGAPFGAALAGTSAETSTPPIGPGGPAAVLAGSASTATQRQIAAFERYAPAMRLRAEDIVADSDTVPAALRWAAQAGGAGTSGPPVLIAADARPAAVASAQSALGPARAAAVLEHAMGLLAQGLVAQGVRRLVVAGGETSGSVSAALGVTALRVGPAITTGVPWMVTPNGELALAFKSGNFGGDHFFADALRRLDGDGNWR